MSSTTEMYAYPRQYNVDATIDLPNCMYSQTPIQSDRIMASSENTPRTVDPRIKEMQVRQEALLAKFTKMREDMASLRSKKAELLAEKAEHVKATEGSTDEGATQFTQGDVLKDMVVSASPASPPLSIFVMKHLFSKKYKTLERCHVHSSVTEVSEELMGACVNTPAQSRAGYILAFTLVWKDVTEGAELMVAPHTQTGVKGESVISRFMSRLAGLPKPDAALDSWLDAAGAALVPGADPGPLLARVGSVKSDYLCGDAPGVADAVVWSVLLQRRKLPTSSAWAARLEERAEYQQALGVARAAGL